MRFQWWQTVLLEWVSNLANSAQLLRKNEFSEMFFLQFFTFSVTFLPVARKKIYIDTNNNSPQIALKIVDKKDNFSFSYMLFACPNLLLIAKKNRCPHLRTKSLSRLTSLFKTFFNTSFFNVIKMLKIAWVLVKNCWNYVLVEKKSCSFVGVCRFLFRRLETLFLYAGNHLPKAANIDGRWEGR